MKEWPKDLTDVLMDKQFERYEKIIEFLGYYDELCLKFWDGAESRHLGLISELWIDEDV